MSDQLNNLMPISDLQRVDMKALERLRFLENAIDKRMTEIEKRLTDIERRHDQDDD